MPMFVHIFLDFFLHHLYFFQFLFVFPPWILRVPEDYEQENKTTWPKLKLCTWCMLAWLQDKNYNNYI